ncbi:MAG: cysteine hydrolase [Deltaproteobacteria bacterium]|nr:cysteine hydrolase [Deltaproteobacteria bacterium]
MMNIFNEWDTVKAPLPPELKPVTVDTRSTALLVLDIQNNNCNSEKRPRCIGSLPGIQRLLNEARSREMPVIFSLTSKAAVEDIRQEVSPIAGEQIVRSGVDKFFNTDLEKILMDAGVNTVIIVGTAAEGAVLHTATGAALRGLDVIVPVDGFSSGNPYAEQYTAWHLVNAPGTRNRATLTQISLIQL